MLGYACVHVSSLHRLSLSLYGKGVGVADDVTNKELRSLGGRRGGNVTTGADL